MKHRLVHGIEQALGWSGPEQLGQDMAVGTLPDPALGPRLLTPHRLLDTVLRRSLSPPLVRCVRDGANLPEAAYLTEVTTRRGQVVPMVSPEGLEQALTDGATFVADGLNRWDPVLEIACRALQWWSEETCQVNTYLTTRDSSGFVLHWDDHDVLVVQLGGEKDWEVRGPSRPAPMFRDLDPNTEPPEQITWSGTLRTGDVLHIPRGWWHRATCAATSSDYSLHATFGIPQRTGVTLLNWLLDEHARGRETLRRDLPRGEPTELAAHTQQITRETHELLSSLDIDQYRRWRRAHQPSARHVRTNGLFGPAEHVVAVTGFPPLIERSEDTLTVAAAGTQLALPARAEPAVRALLSGHPASVAEVSATTGLDAAKIADVLLQEGLCAELTEALRWGCSELAPAGT